MGQAECRSQSRPPGPLARSRGQRIPSTSTYNYISGLLACSQSATSSQLSPTWDGDCDGGNEDNGDSDGNTDVIRRVIITVYTTSHPKATSRSSTQHKVCRLKQVEVVAHVVHHIPGQHEKDDNRVDDNNDKDDNHVDDELTKMT